MVLYNRATFVLGTESYRGVIYPSMTFTWAINIRRWCICRILYPSGMPDWELIRLRCTCRIWVYLPEIRASIWDPDVPEFSKGSPRWASHMDSRILYINPSPRWGYPYLRRTSISQKDIHISEMGISTPKGCSYPMETYISQKNIHILLVSLFHMNMPDGYHAPDECPRWMSYPRATSQMDVPMYSRLMSISQIYLGTQTEWLCNIARFVLQQKKWRIFIREKATNENPYIIWWFDIRGLKWTASRPNGCISTG